MRVIAVRHFRTQSNAGGRIIGWGDSPRCPGWEKDLVAVDKALKRNGVEVDAIYSSNLGRARETAEYFFRKYSTAPMYHDARLNEVNYGDLYHMRKDWVVSNVPEYKTDPDYVFPAGESFRQMQQRSVEFLRSLDTAHKNQTLLLVVHAGVIRGLVCHFLGLEYGRNLKRKISHRYIGDFQIERGKCTRYDELGKASGFVSDGVISPGSLASDSGVPQKVDLTEPGPLPLR